VIIDASNASRYSVEKFIDVKCKSDKNRLVESKQ
jgi:hypothetical protein